jgi:hypothetical protein
MENKKSKKISFTILPFFYNFLHIFKVLLEKEKGKGLNSVGLVSAQRPSPEGKGAPARARARVAILQKGPQHFGYLLRIPGHCSTSH